MNWWPAYSEVTRALIEGGVDMILIETVFDTLNAKAALFAVRQVFDEVGERAAHHRLGHDHRCLGPHAVGSDHRGVLEFHPPRQPAVVGLNCALGGKQLRPYIEELSRIADTYVCAYPNAGSAECLRRIRRDAGSKPRRRCASSRPADFVNMVGGCCGTTPEHIRAISARRRGTAAAHRAAASHRPAA